MFLEERVARIRDLVRQAIEIRRLMNTPVEMPGAEVTSKVVDVHHTVNGQDIVLPERVNEVGTFATIFGAGKYSELIWALVIVAGVQVLLTLTRWGMLHRRQIVLRHKIFPRICNGRRNETKPV